MKFHVAWARVLTENQILKGAVLVLSFLSAILSLSLARASIKRPVIIERGCFSRHVTPVDDKHSSKEIEEFLREALQMRFDSSAIDYEALLSKKETQYREKEQKDLKKKGLSQRVIINQIHTEQKLYDIELDKVISTGKVRTAIPLKVQVEISSTERTPSNPYGLLLNRLKERV